MVGSQDLVRLRRREKVKGRGRSLHGFCHTLLGNHRKVKTCKNHSCRLVLPIGVVKSRLQCPMDSQTADMCQNTLISGGIYSRFARFGSKWYQICLPLSTYGPIKSQPLDGFQKFWMFWKENRLLFPKHVQT